MFCSNCGKQIKDGSKFCIYCGEKLANDAAGEALDTPNKEAAETTALQDPADSQSSTPTAPDSAKTTVIPDRANREAAATPDYASERTDVIPNPSRKPSDTAPLKPIYPGVPQQEPYKKEPKRRNSSTKTIVIAAVALAIAVCAIVLAIAGVVTGNASKQDAEPAATAAAAATAEAASTEVATTESETEEAETQAATEATSPEVVYVTTKEYVYVPVPEQNSSSGYVLPDSASRVYSTEELEALSTDILWYARNEIYARHGRKFKDQNLQAYFNGKSWYTPVYEPDEFDSYVTLSSTEQQNAANIKQIESSRGSSHL